MGPIETFDDVEAFRAVAEPWLLRDEAMNCLPLGLLGTIARDRTRYPASPYLAVAREAGELRLVALRTPPRNLVVAGQRSSGALLDALAEDVRRHCPDLPGVMGPVALAQALAGRVAGPRGSTRLAMDQRVYELTHLHPVPAVPGAARPATEADLPGLEAWARAFSAEAEPHEDDAAAAGRMLVRGRWPFSREGGFMVWEDAGQLVAMAGFAGPTGTGIRVGPVYTPPARRGQGYATALVAYLSQWLLDSGYARCFLFTDLANPTSNRMYRRIGYRPVGDVRVYRVTRL
jgi:predicted GNAT family acetyltransferase